MHIWIRTTLNAKWFVALLVLAVAAVEPSVAVIINSSDTSFIALGTMGGPVSSPVRSQPANVLLHADKAYLVDTGDGAVQQLAKAGVQLSAVRAIFISHLHVDHIGGLEAVLGLRIQTLLPGVVTIYGPPGTQLLVDGIVAALQPSAQAAYGIPGRRWASPESTVKVIEMTDGSKVDVDGITVTAAQNTHYDFAPGSPDDQRFKSLSFRFDLPGRSIVYTGDTGPSEAVERLAKGADLLVSEMIDLEMTVATIHRVEPNMPKPQFEGMMKHLSTHHLSPLQVGELAARAGVKSVVVTHLAPGTTTQPDLDRYVREIQRNFHGPVTIANDLDRF